MLEKLKNLFKKNKDYIIFNIDIEKYHKDKTILCYEDLYKATGIFDAVKQIREDNKEGKYHYKNIQANSNTYRKIEEVLRDNLLNTKNKYSKFYRPEYLSKKSAFDCLMWSPYTNEMLADGVIKVLLPNNKDFERVKEGN